MRIAKDLQVFTCEPERIELAEEGAGVFRNQAAAWAKQGALAQIVLGKAKMVSADRERAQGFVLSAWEKCLYPKGKAL